MAGNPQVGIGHLTTQAHEFVKQYVAYDVNNRPEYVYTVRADAEDGTPCSVVQYAYAGLTSRIVYMKESAATWDVSWEAF